MGVLRIIQRYFFLFLNENICCDPSLEPSRRDGSNDGSQNMCFCGKILINSQKIIPVIPSDMEHWSNYDIVKPNISISGRLL